MSRYKGKRKHEKRKHPVLRIAGALMLALAAIVFVNGSASATDASYATVTSHAPFSSDANNPDFWGDNCTKVEEPGGSAYVLPAGTYTKVIVKAGAGEFANTIFAAPPKAGETVWADTNGNGSYDPGGKDGDKDISHVITCAGSPPSKTEVSGDVKFYEGSVACVDKQVVYTNPTYVVGGNEHVVYDTPRGSHTANFGESVTVKATGVDDDSQYVLTGQTTWSNTFGTKPTAPTDCGTTPPPPPCTVQPCLGPPPVAHPHPHPGHTPTYNTPAVAETGHSTGFPWLQTGAFGAAVLMLTGLGLYLRRGPRRGQAR